MISTDVVFIGAGAVGLFQIFELGLLGLRAQHRPHAANRRAVHQVVSRQTDLRYAGNPGLRRTRIDNTSAATDRAVCEAIPSRHRSDRGNAPP